MHASTFTKFQFIVSDARVFPGIWFDFIYPHNSSLFLATPQIYVTADKNKTFLQPCTALKQTFTNVYFYEVVPTLTKQYGKQNLQTNILLLFSQFALYKSRNTYK